MSDLPERAIEAGAQTARSDRGVTSPAWEVVQESTREAWRRHICAVLGAAAEEIECPRCAGKGEKRDYLTGKVPVRGGVNVTIEPIQYGFPSCPLCSGRGVLWVLKR